MTDGEVKPPMVPRERCDFSAIVDRPPLRLPGGARLIVWTIVNYEVWEIARAMIRELLKTEGMQGGLLNAVLEVTDDEGEIVLEFPFAEAILDLSSESATRH